MRAFRQSIVLITVVGLGACASGARSRASTAAIARDSAVERAKYSRDQYLGCVKAYGKANAKSTATATEIGVAAIASCREWSDAFRAETEIAMRSQWVVSTAGTRAEGLAEGEGRRRAAESTGILDEQARETAMQAVVEARKPPLR